jgi:hypothetical protein
MKHMEHLDEIFETLETYAYNMRFLAQRHLTAWTNEGSLLRSSTPTQRSGGAAWSSLVRQWCGQLACGAA